MKHAGFEYKFRPPLAPPEARDGKPPVYRRTFESGMIVERDLAVKMRDGVDIYIDVFRPADERPAAPIIAWGPYGKHGHTRYAENFPNCGVKQETLSPYTAFEAPDAGYWVPRGYAVINPDPRGTWYSKGDATYLSPEEAQDFYDLIEWAGTQPWSNGKVGLSGVSYLTSSQWRVAALNPPHLAAFNPWEGWSDTYREVVRHGGIPETMFWPYLAGRWGHSTTRVEDLATEKREHPFFDAFWASKAASFSTIKAPAYIVASWTDQGMHTRGTLEGFKKIASPQKWLEVHGRKKWAYYYDPESVRRQQEFFDYFLKGIPTSVTQWPKVRLEVRERFYVGAMKAENEWPIARTQYTKLYLNAQNGALERRAVLQEASFRYNARGEGDAPRRAQFDFTFEQPTELIGHMKLKLWAAADGAGDMDIFVAIQKLDAAGNIVPFAFWAHFDDGPVALGWLRASHRELDAANSTEYQPVLLHRREMKLDPGAVVPLEIELWPSGTRFEAGEKLRLVVQGTDIYNYPKPVMCDRHEDAVNRGHHILYTGGRYDSHLLVPIVPPESV
ncbi:MAG TPA: CocE/NonD family hydrolase [Candidatus Polarisedimenticolia bacterium]|nr:CocE/NonD family hydrolase [Candidatus Polarisedimenticolia bacterium]